MALLGSTFSGAVKRVVSIAGGDLYVIGKLIEANPDFREAHRQFKGIPCNRFRCRTHLRIHRVGKMGVQQE